MDAVREKQAPFLGVLVLRSPRGKGGRAAESWSQASPGVAWGLPWGPQA